MHTWIIVLIVLWAVILVCIMLIFARALHSHSRHAPSFLDPLPLPTAYIPHHNHVPHHNSVLLYPPSARSAGLTSQQVAAAAPVRTGPVPPDSTCTICLDDIAHTEKARYIHACDHFFHSACIRIWLRRSNTCPNCNRIALEEPGVELEIETVSSKDWRSFGYSQWVGQVGQVSDRPAMA